MKKISAILRYSVLAAIFWTLVVAASLFTYIERTREQVMKMASADALTSLNKDISFRRWATRHGGVYVPITASQQSVPWLSHVPGRDVTTTDGRQLTLLNPASMLRQVMDDYAAEYGTRGRITGLKTLNPGNAPDPWEKTQLEAFQRGERKEIQEISNLDGTPHLRYSRAMFMEPGCDKCHAILGYKTGDMRGAIGVSLPLTTYYQHIDLARRDLALGHGISWLLGLTGIGWAARQARAHQGDHEREEARILLLNASLEERVQRRTAQLEALNRELEAFSYSVSHDLRAPLRSIDGFSQALAEDYAEHLDEVGHDYLDRVRHAAQRMGLLIDDMLRLARITRVEMQSVAVDLTAVAQEVATDIMTHGQYGEVQLRLQAGLTIYGDPALLRVVLENLLDNAWKYSSKIAKPLIEVGSMEENGRTVYFVRDNGAGFDMAYVGKLFGAFQRLHRADEFPGTGIGLATVKRIIHRHGGEIWAEGQPGKGAIFRFTLAT